MNKLPDQYQLKKSYVNWEPATHYYRTQYVEASAMTESRAVVLTTVTGLLSSMRAYEREIERDLPKGPT